MKLGPVWINLAHVNHQQKNYETAIRLYQTCLTDFGEGVDENIHLYLAKAYFDSGNLAVLFQKVGNLPIFRIARRHFLMP